MPAGAAVAVGTLDRGPQGCASPRQRIPPPYPWAGASTAQCCDYVRPLVECDVPSDYSVQAEVHFAGLERSYFA